MDSNAWQAIRALRAAPTGAAVADPDRRRTFAAALRQAEELAEAAQEAGYASKPLPLFYSLSQAGRAIAAAHLSGPWMLQGHGLSPTLDVSMPILDTLVSPKSNSRTVDSFRGVTTAIGSPTLNGRATLGELWAVNPDLLDVPVPSSAGSFLLPVELAINSPYMHMPTYDENEEINTGGTVLISAIIGDGKTGHDIAAKVARYPTLRDTFAVKQGPNGAERAGSDDAIIQGLDDPSRPVTNLAVDISPRPLVGSSGAVNVS